MKKYFFEAFVLKNDFSFLALWARGEKSKEAETKVNREQKKELISTLNEVFGETEIVIVTHYSGITVAEISKLRSDIRNVGASFRVTKNRITRLALKGTKCDQLADMFKGPTAITCSKDPVSAAKAIVAFAKENEKLIILGAIMNGQMLDAKDVKALATLPSLDEIRAKIVGVLQAPASKIARIVKEPAASVARVTGAYAREGKAA